MKWDKVVHSTKVLNMAIVNSFETFRVLDLCSKSYLDVYVSENQYDLLIET